MNKTLSITLKVGIFAVIAGAGIIYILNTSPVEDMGTYEKHEMATPNKSKSIVDQFFSPATSKKNTGFGSADDMSLTGQSGRYDEVRIGKDVDDE